MNFEPGHYYRNSRTTVMVYVVMLEIPYMGGKVVAFNEYGCMEPLRFPDDWKEVTELKWSRAVKRAERAMKRHYK